MASFCASMIKKRAVQSCMQGVSLKRIGNASFSVVEAVEAVGSLVLYGLEVFPRGNK